MFPTPRTDTPASAPAIASPPSGGGAHRAAPPTAFATLMDAGAVKTTQVAAASGSGDGTASGVDQTSAVASNGDDAALTATLIDARHRAIAGPPSRMIRIDAATVLPAWMQSARATTSVQLDALADAAGGDDDDADDVAADGAAHAAAESSASIQTMLAAAVDPQILATQIPVPGDEDAAPPHDASQESAGAVPSGSGAEQGSANGRFALNNRSLLALNAPDQPAGAWRGAQMAMAHASDQALAHASTNSELNPADADSLSADAQGVDGRLTGDSLLDQLSSTPERAERASNGHKSGHAAVRDIARSLSAATRHAQPSATAVAGAPPSDATIQPSPARSTTRDGTVQADASHKLSIAMEAPARRSDMAAIPSIRFADTADTDAGAQGNLDDAPRDQHQQPSASAMTRLMAGVVSAAGDAHASTQAHAVAPAFSVPATATASATPAVTPTETAAAANAGAPDAQNIDRLVQSMHVNAKSGVMEATVRLRPDYLGDVTIELRVDGTGVSAVVRAESASVRQWLESHEQTIRSGLAEHGLELTRFIVDPDGQPQSQQDTQPDRDEQRRAAFRRRQQERSSQRFEITV